MEMINLTPHAVNIVGENGEPVATVAPSGTVARVATTREIFVNIDGVPFYITRYGEPVGLPEPRQNVIYIVAGMLLQAVPDRTDVWQPGELLRNERGEVVGCVGLSRPPFPDAQEA